MKLKNLLVAAVAGFAVMAAFAGEAVAQAPIATSVKSMVCPG